MLCVHVCHCVRELLTVDFGLRLVQLKLFVEQVIYNLEEVLGEDENHDLSRMVGGWMLLWDISATEK